MIAAAMLSAVMACIAPPSFARVLRFPEDFETIQDAIEFGEDGDSVLVGPGTWSGSRNCSIDPNTKNLVILASGGPDLTTIDCQHVTPGFFIGGGQSSDCVVFGFTIKNASRYGLHVTNASPRILNCKFTGCATGARFDSSPWVDVRQCAFDSNDGSGVVLVGCYGDIRNCTMRGNGRAGSGSGIELHRSNPGINESVISGNLSATNGGGVYGDSASFGLGHCVITGNRAMGRGGGVYLSAWGSIGMEGCTVSRNVAEEGGGIYCSGTTYLDRTIIWGNCASGDGREVFLDSQVYGLATCVDVDLAGVGGSGNVTWSGSQLHSDPQLCDMRSCSAAPTTDGSYTLAAGSPCLVGSCGPVGALGAGCTETPTRRSTWGRIRFGFR
jgi:predicted outer membrane repeat protein